LDLSNSIYLTEKDYLLSPKDIAKPGDIVLSMSGTIGMTALVPDDVTKSIINQRILRITPQNVDKNYLILLLNSILGSFQLERIGTGGVQTNISYKDIKNILIPILPKPTQQKIAELVQKSHEARKKAKELLEEAKRKVESLIENN
jgi:type I restriction enzyme S subunit